MSFVRIDSQRFAQPQGAVGIDRGIPLTRGLAFLFNAGGGAVDLVSRRLPSTQNATRAVGSKGLTFKASSGKPLVFPVRPVTTSDGAGGADFTIFALSNPANVGTRMAMVSQDALGAGQMYLIANCNTSYAASAGMVFFGAVDSTGQGTPIDAASQTDGAYHLWVGLRRGTTSELYRDGVLVGSTSGITRNLVTGSFSSVNVAIGCLNGYTGYDSTADNVLAGAWNRALAPVEIATLAANPWQLFEQEQQAIWMPDSLAAAPRRRVVMWG